MYYCIYMMCACMGCLRYCSLHGCVCTHVCCIPTKIHVYICIHYAVFLYEYAPYIYICYMYVCVCLHIHAYAHIPSHSALLVPNDFTLQIMCLYALLMYTCAAFTSSVHAYCPCACFKQVCVEVCSVCVSVTDASLQLSELC